MRVFFKNNVLFLFLLTILILSFNIGSNLIIRNFYSYNIAKDKNILILGDSHTEVSLNDSIISNSINFSLGTSSYFHSYIKLKYILSNNEHIDTLILGYSFNSLTNFSG